MKQKLMMLLAVLLTGGMLVACGPGDEGAQDTTDGVVTDDPLGQDPAADDPLADDTADPVAQDPAAQDQPADDPEAETTVELTPEEDAAASEEAPADETEADVDVAQDETEDQAAQDQAEGDVAGGGAAAPAEGEPVVVTFTQAAEGVSVENVQGADDAQQVASTEESNPELTLTTGQRYEFNWDGEGDLVFMNGNDEEIFSTAGTDSEFANNEEVNAVMESGQVAFTVTEDLAGELARYAAGPDQQGGNITVQ